MKTLVIVGMCFLVYALYPQLNNIRKYFSKNNGADPIRISLLASTATKLALGLCLLYDLNLFVGACFLVIGLQKAALFHQETVLQLLKSLWSGIKKVDLWIKRKW